MSIPETTRAAVLTGLGEPLAVQELPLPRELPPGSALVAIGVSTLCGTDVEIWHGAMGAPPMVLGHEMVGTVVAAGPGTTDALGRPVEIGRRIGWSESTCGHCRGCLVERNPVHCEHRVYTQDARRWPHVIAGWSEYSYVAPGCDKYILPDSIPDTWASMAGCAAKTVLHAFERSGGIRPGATVAIQGAGALGIFAAAVASVSGAGRVILIGGPQARLALGAHFGATDAVDVAGGSEAVVEQVHAATGGRGADHLFDFAGAPTVAAEAVGMAAPRASYTVVGTTAPGLRQLPLSAVMGLEMTITGSLNGDVADYVRAVDFFETFADRFPWDELFEEPVGLANATDALAAMQSQSVVKPVIDPRL